MNNIFLYAFFVAFNTYSQSFKPTFNVYYDEVDSTYYFDNNLDSNEFYITNIILHLEGAPGVFESNSDNLNAKQIEMLLMYPNKKAILKIIYFSKNDKILYFTMPNIA